MDKSRKGKTYCRKETKKGKRITSSTSKIKKIIANKKNRKLKGRVPGSAELNPHSNGLRSSRSKENFFVNPKTATMIITPRIKPETKIVRFIKIET